MSPGPVDPGPSADDQRPRRLDRSAGASALRVAVTRSHPLMGGDRLAELLDAMGARVLARPLLRFRPPRDPGALREMVAELVRVAARSLHESTGEETAHAAASDDRGGRGEGFDPEDGAVWLVVTSRNTIPPLNAELERQGWTFPSLTGTGIRVAAVGSGTARALADAGMPPNLMPERFTGEELLIALQQELGAAIRGTRILLPRAQEAREVLPRGLARAGADVMVAPAYRVEPDPAQARTLVREIRGGEVDVVTFTSGSAVSALAEAWSEAGGMDWPPAVVIAVIGPVTASTVRSKGWPVGMLPHESTLEALAAAVLDVDGIGSG